jgi:hypothetical protein
MLSFLDLGRRLANARKSYAISFPAVGTRNPDPRRAQQVQCSYAQIFRQLASVSIADLAIALEALTDLPNGDREDNQQNRKPLDRSRWENCSLLVWLRSAADIAGEKKPRRSGAKLYTSDGRHGEPSGRTNINDRRWD